MLGYLIILFTVIPALELVMLIKVGEHIGAINTLILIIFTGVLGAYLARIQGILVLIKINRSLNMGVIPTDEMLDGLMIFCGGILLLTPGFMTDTLGFLLLLPLMRAFIKKWVRRKFERMIQVGVFAKESSLEGNDDFIDV